MKEYVATLDMKLDAPVTDNGENFSVGYRQLICIARAMLCKSKIMVMDEASSSLDMQTDNVIQRTIRDTLLTCTVITIAHRLQTVIDSDRVLVMEEGRLMEFDTPLNLLNDPKSHFYALVQATGPTEVSMRSHLFLCELIDFLLGQEVDGSLQGGCEHGQQANRPRL